MTEYSVLDEADLKPRYQRYKSQCHAEARFRNVVMFTLLRFHATALNRFRSKQVGVKLVKRNLWGDFSNPPKKKIIDTASPAEKSQTPLISSKRKRGPARPIVSDIKSAFRKYIEEEQKNRCCYCRRWLCNSGYSKPIEHILPRETYEQYSFHFWNLSVACVDCNSIKNKNDWASPEKKDLEVYPAPSTFTEMFHPRFHRFDDHVRFIRVQTNDHSITLYRGITPQGKKLCDDLLTVIAGKEVLINSNAALKESMETIQQYDVKEGSQLESALTCFYGALSEHTIELLKY